MINKVCKKCRGSRHYIDPRRGYVKCECLKRSKASDRYKKAGIPTRFVNGSWQSFFSQYKLDSNNLVKESIKLKKGEVSGGCYVVSGRPSGARALLGALMLRAACDGLLGCRRVDIDELVDLEFDRQGESFDQGIYRFPFLVVDIGGEPDHKYNRHVVKKIVRRWEDNRTTVFLSSLTPTTLAHRYSDAGIQEAITERFESVWLEPMSVRYRKA